MYSSLFASLQIVSAPRMDRKKLYPLDFLLLIVFLSTLSGCTSWYEIEDYGMEYEDELKRLYEQLTGDQLTYTMPSHDTLNRSISLLNVAAFEEAYKCWIEAFISATSGKHICIDGKTMRGVKKLSFEAHSHVVSAFSPEDMCSLAQVYIDGKSNEIPAIHKLLQTLDLNGAIVSIDAIGTQTDVAEQIIDNGGDYLLCVKGNQSLSLQEIESYFCSLFQKHILVDEQTELSHGRIETRRYESILNPLALESNEVLTRWKGLKSIHKVVRKRQDKKSGKASEEVVYYISSSTESSLLRQSIRGHWAIENNLHHCLDVYLGHDASLKRANNVAQIMDIIQKINLFIITRLKTNMKSSIPRVQKKLARTKPTEIATLQF